MSEWTPEREREFLESFTISGPGSELPPGATTSPAPADMWADIQHAFTLIRDSRPTILVDASDYDAVLAAAEGKPINVEKSPFVQPGRALYLAPMNSGLK